MGFTTQRELLEWQQYSRSPGLRPHRRRAICCYVLYNFKDTPDDLYKCVTDLLSGGEHGPPPRCSKRHRGQWVVSGELTRFSQAPQYRSASPTDRLLKRMETGRGGCCNPSPASVSDQVHQTSYPYEEAFKQDTGAPPILCGFSPFAGPMPSRMTPIFRRTRPRKSRTWLRKVAASSDTEARFLPTGHSCASSRVPRGSTRPLRSASTRTRHRQQLLAASRGNQERGLNSTSSLGILSRWARISSS